MVLDLEMTMTLALLRIVTFLIQQLQPMEKTFMIQEQAINTLPSVEPTMVSLTSSNNLLSSSNLVDLSVMQISLMLIL